MACVGCIEKNKQHENTKILKEAYEMAVRTGKWVAIYTDATGTERYADADIAREQRYPVQQYITPSKL